MSVISDTSPLCYLVLIEQIDLLPQLYDQIIIPDMVQRELQTSSAPIAVQQWINQPPPWLLIQTLSQPTDPALNRLDPGEQAAIALAEQLNARLLLIDERYGRKIALQRGLSIIGIIGLLDAAATQALIHLPTVIQRLQATNFRISPRLLEALLDKYA
jgi:predicted nucleic acid-binding protein